MCRLAAFPPGFTREAALALLTNIEGNNRDGVGSAYVKDGQFICQRYPFSLKELLKNRGHPFLAHMPCDSWTIAHLRMGTHGKNTVANTHPFVAGDWAVVHNGIWSEYHIAKLALSRAVQFKGDTDSEVAAHLINLAGPKAFAATLEEGGVFLCLNRNGQLHVVKLGGLLSFLKLENGQTLMATEFDTRTVLPGEVSQGDGWFKFKANGKASGGKPKRDSWGSWGHTPTAHYTGHESYPRFPGDYTQSTHLHSPAPPRITDAEPKGFPSRSRPQPRPKTTATDGIKQWCLDEHGEWKLMTEHEAFNVVNGFTRDGFPYPRPVQTKLY